ncbi:MAG: SPOR domain-containing protein [Marinilabiliaceae bacterium]|nr:SPOR domain-containing protein [Marinilabiliaceae bacterium]
MILLKTISALTFSIIIISCASLKNKGTSRFDDSNSPYVQEKTATPKPKPQETKTAQNVVVREEKVKAIASETDQTNYNFYVIIGSFRIIDNAYNYKNQLIEEGFKPVILENENGLYRISVKSTNIESEARNNIASIRSKFAQHEDVWLLISKK